MVNKKYILVILLLGILLFAIPVLSAEQKYTRENAEALKHLIEWQEYGPEAFENAINEQKPIFLLISAPAWCYWCHVYESKDYLFHPVLPPFINEEFIPIFVDSDKRPDLTRKYLEGGWPSTTIFTPDRQRLEGFSGPRDPNQLLAYLQGVVRYVEQQSFGLEQELIYQKAAPFVPKANHLAQFEQNYRNHLVNSFDEKYGGFITGNPGDSLRVQRFPSGLNYKFLLEQYEKRGDERLLTIVKETAKHQYTRLSELETRYHLYDPVEGGFHRYTTQRDWSVPHYEKMLQGQAKLGIAYTHLLEITGDEDVRVATEGTYAYVREKLLHERGGFSSSQDAFLEEEYYGLNEEERAAHDSPYIDYTIKMDETAMMISSFLYAYDTLENEEYAEAATRSLNFLQKEMIGKQGAYYYIDEKRSDASLTGLSVANSWAMLAFLDGYEVLDEPKYLETAEELAEYSLANLYDWESGGFFERNSNDEEFYAPSERVDLSRPYRENAVYSYAMLRIHLLTGKLEYLEAGVKALGNVIQRSSGMEETYYALKAGELLLEKNLLDTYEKEQVAITQLLEKERASFWVTSLLEQQQEEGRIDAPRLKSELADVGFFILALLAFAAGILSFLSPCTLPVLTAYFAYNVNAKKGEILKNTLLFLLGLALIFSLFGMGATLLGALLREYRLIFTRVAGLGIIIFGLLQIFGKGFSGFDIPMRSMKKGPWSSFLFGILFGVGWSACTGPLLASFLLLSATTSTVVKGSALLFIYALGLGLPLLISALFFERIKSKHFWKLLKGRELKFTLFKRKMSVHSTTLISGLLLILIGVLIFGDLLFKLNTIALQTGYVQEIIIKGETFLQNFFLDSST